MFFKRNHAGHSSYDNNLSYTMQLVNSHEKLSNVNNVNHRGHNSPMGLWVTLLGGSGQENTVSTTHKKYRMDTKEYVPTTPIF